MGEEVVPESQESKESISDLEAKIIRQIEYYFGNYNLGKDKFLREEIKKDEGWVPLETMVKFNRLKSLSEDFQVIATALNKSPNQLIEVDEENTKIRRRAEKPLPEDNDDQRKDRDERTLYVKGFQKTTTLDELLEFFKPHKCENILMRRWPQASRVFKGSVFVTFETKEDAQKFLETKDIKYSGLELLKETKKAYIARKDIYYNNLREEKAKKNKQPDDENKEESITEVPTSEIKIKEGCCLKVTGVESSMIREVFKEAFEPYGVISYTDYNRGNSEGVIRFEESIAADVLQKIPEVDGQRKLKIGSSDAVITLIEGEEEQEYFKFIAINRANARKRFQNRGSFHNKGFGNRGRFKKNWGKRNKKFDENNEPPKKKAKAEDNSENVPEKCADES